MTAKPSTDDLVLLLSQMEHHWPYHQEQLKKLAAGISTTKRVGKARKRR
jgi:protein-tyrosine phosphatase